MSEQILDDENINEQRRKKIEEMKRNKRKQETMRKNIKRVAPAVAGVFAVVLATAAVGTKLHNKAPENNIIVADMTEMADISSNDGGLRMKNGVEATEEIEVTEVLEEVSAKPVVYTAQVTDDTVALGADIISEQAILVDLSTNDIIAQKDAMSRINPASMTKILTVLVAAEQVENLDDTFTITLDITDFSYTNDCSAVGFAENETVTVRDLFYGTILPSGGDATAALATYVAGSQEAFVELMNEKLAELGLSDTAHVTNCVGLYNEEHYCTAYDMAMILEAAINNELCHEVLSAHTYTTSATEQHPEGITISNWFLRRIEDKDSGGTVMCAKTGYVVQSGNCAASYALDAEGKGYICVTVHATSGWNCIYDHVAIYKRFMPETVSEDESEESTDNEQ